MHADASLVAEAATIRADLATNDRHRLWTAHATVDKWDADQTQWATHRLGRPPIAADFAALRIHPPETVEAAGNLATTAGLTRITSLITGGGGQAATNTSARLGVGDSTTAATTGDTDLGAASGSTHRWFQVMDATYPQTSGGVITFKASFGGGDGNFAWAEWGVDIGTPTVSSGATVNATLLNHKIASLGTKASGTWALTATLTIA